MEKMTTASQRRITLSKLIFDLTGMLVAHWVLQEGPGLPCLSVAVYDFITKGDCYPSKANSTKSSHDGATCIHRQGNEHMGIVYIISMCYALYLLPFCIFINNVEYSKYSLICGILMHACTYLYSTTYIHIATCM